MALLVAAIVLPSCSHKGEKDENFDKTLVINEVLTSNRTGLLDEDGDLTDWIEIKNISDKDVSLKDYVLTSEKKKKEETAGEDGADKKDKKEKKKDKKNKKDKADKDGGDDAEVEMETKEWVFPDVTVKAGECILVMASKKDRAKAGKELHASFKVPGKNTHLQIVSPSGTIMTDFKVDELEPDQSCFRKEDGTYEKTYKVTPGQDNDEKGFEAYNELIDSQRKSPLLIWEFMTRSENKSLNWVEVKNVGDQPVELQQYALTTNLDKEDKRWNFPAVTLEPGKTYTVQLAGKSADEKRPEQSTLKTNSSETIILCKDGKFVDGVCAKTTKVGSSIGRVEGRKGFFYFESPSRNADNTATPYRTIAQLPRLDKAPGVYLKEDKLVLHFPEDRTIHYTLDGSWPGKGSKVYQDSIVIDTTTVVRAYDEGDSLMMSSPVMTATYVMRTEHTLPIVSISVNDGDLYNHNSGIYADGPGFNSEWPHMGANYWKDWEKRAHVELIDGKEGFSVDCGLRIFGGFSRAEAKKSFSIKFRNRYGVNELKYDLYNRGKAVEYKNFVLRSGSQDYARCMIRDEFFTSLMAPECPTMLVQDYRPVALYVNGKYFGLYYIREKIDRHFVARKLGTSDDAITILMSLCYNELGSKVRFRELLNYVSSHDMSNKEYFDYVKTQVDFTSLIDQELGEFYSGNADLGNVRYVCSADEDCDQKWYFVYYDIDASWNNYLPLSKYIHPAATGNVALQTNLVHHLMRNDEFRQLFLERASHHFHKTFSPKHASKVFDDLIETIRPEMEHNCKRWPNLRYDRWEKNIADFRAQILTKPALMLKDLRQELNVTPEEDKKYFSDLDL